MTNLGFPACFTPDRDYGHSGYSPYNIPLGNTLASSFSLVQ